MAREILFRGKKINGGDWIAGDLLHDYIDGGDTCIWIDRDIQIPGYNLFPNLPGPDQVIPESVGQFTGRTDKKGKRIFEGDIAKYMNKDGTPAFYEVVWDNEFSALMFRFIGGWSGVFMAGMNELVEIIGNIHDNPELLNGKES